jgi:flagellar biosynthesis protein FlhA
MMMRRIMANKKRLPIFTLAGIGILGIIILIPLPAAVVDILIALNLLILFIFFIIVHIKKPSVSSVLPAFLLVLTIFGLIVCIFSTRLVLVKGKALNDWLISPIASNSNDIMGIIRSFVFFILLIAFYLVICSQVLTRISESIAWYFLDDLLIKKLMIETKYYSDVITE